jgi:hypothetical protein
MKPILYALAVVVGGAMTALLISEWAGLKRYIKIERM